MRESVCRDAGNTKPTTRSSSPFFFSFGGFYNDDFQKTIPQDGKCQPYESFGAYTTAIDLYATPHPENIKKCKQPKKEKEQKKTNNFHSLLRSPLPSNNPLLPLGLLLRPPRHPQQTLPKHPRNHPRAILRLASRLLRRLPTRISGPRQLAATPLRLQSRLYLGIVFVRHWSPRGVAVHSAQVVWRVLRGNFHHWKWFGLARDGCESVYYRLWSAEVCGDSDQFFSGV